MEDPNTFVLVQKGRQEWGYKFTNYVWNGTTYNEGSAGFRAAFHRGRANFLMVDGHVEAIELLKTLGMPLYNSTTNVTLQPAYTAAMD
jgi:prepilin-type processing-associated H-X9-DG protein